MTSRKSVFWTDLRSKRNITAAHLTRNTYDDCQFYDPLLSPNVGVERVAPGIEWFSQALPNSCSSICVRFDLLTTGCFSI